MPRKALWMFAVVSLLLGLTLRQVSGEQKIRAGRMLAFFMSLIDSSVEQVELSFGTTKEDIWNHISYFHEEGMILWPMYNTWFDAGLDRFPLKKACPRINKFHGPEIAGQQWGQCE